MSAKLRGWLRAWVMLALLAVAFPVHAFYNPGTGRWLSRDPLGEKGGANLHGLNKNNPVDWIDKLGLKLIEKPVSKGKFTIEMSPIKYGISGFIKFFPNLGGCECKTIKLAQIARVNVRSMDKEPWENYDWKDTKEKDRMSFMVEGGWFTDVLSSQFKTPEKASIFYNGMALPNVSQDGYDTEGRLSLQDYTTFPMAMLFGGQSLKLAHFALIRIIGS